MVNRYGIQFSVFSGTLMNEFTDGVLRIIAANPEKLLLRYSATPTVAFGISTEYYQVYYDSSRSCCGKSTNPVCKFNCRRIFPSSGRRIRSAVCWQCERVSYHHNRQFPLDAKIRLAWDSHCIRYIVMILKVVCQFPGHFSSFSSPSWLRGVFQSTMVPWVAQWLIYGLLRSMLVKEMRKHRVVSFINNT